MDTHDRFERYGTTLECTLLKLAQFVGNSFNCRAGSAFTNSWSVRCVFAVHSLKVRSTGEKQALSQARRRGAAAAVPYLFHGGEN